MGPREEFFRGSCFSGASQSMGNVKTVVVACCGLIDQRPLPQTQPVQISGDPAPGRGCLLDYLNKFVINGELGPILKGGVPDGLSRAGDHSTTPHGLLIIVVEIILSAWLYPMRWQLMLDRLLGWRDCLLTRRLLPPSGVSPSLDVRNFRTCLKVAAYLCHGLVVYLYLISDRIVGRPRLRLQ